MTDAQIIYQRARQLSRIADEPGRTTRLFASPAMRAANRLVAGWMREAGLKTRLDAAGNLIGYYPGQTPNAKVLLLGSHLDTVRDAGAFDGPLGVLLAIACVAKLHQARRRLPFALEVIGFSDEEGVRYQTTYLGSKALIGKLTRRELQLRDADGVTLAKALAAFGGKPENLRSARKAARNLVGYLETHIEQGPVLEREHLSVGVVTAIAGQARARVTFQGEAGHAGTVPMALRRDALTAAAAWIQAVEQLARRTPGLMATVGQLQVGPGAGNVIPGQVQLSLDVRHARDGVRAVAWRRLQQLAQKIARQRHLRVQFKMMHSAAAVACAREFTQTLAQAVQKHQPRVLRLPSGAGHDAAVMAAITPVAMLFVRCRRGISHHPAESVRVADIAIALRVMTDFLVRQGRKHESA